MLCFRVKKRLLAYDEGALNEKRAAAVARHLERCSRCAKELESIRRAAAAVRATKPPAMSPPPNLWARVESSLNASPSSAPQRRNRGVQLVGATAAAVIVFAAFHVSRVYDKVVSTPPPGIEKTQPGEQPIDAPKPVSNPAAQQPAYREDFTKAKDRPAQSGRKDAEYASQPPSAPAEEPGREVVSPPVLLEEPSSPSAVGRLEIAADAPELVYGESADVSPPSSSEPLAALSTAGPEKIAARRSYDAISPAAWNRENAVFLAAKGDVEGALQAFSLGLDSNPVSDDAGILTEVESLGLLSQLAEMYEKKSALGDSESHLLVLANIYDKMSDYDSAVAARRKLVDINPTNQFYWVLLGDALSQAGNAAEAKSAYQRAVQMNTDPAVTGAANDKLQSME